MKKIALFLIAFIIVGSLYAQDYNTKDKIKQIDQQQQNRLNQSIPPTPRIDSTLSPPVLNWPEIKPLNIHELPKPFKPLKHDSLRRETLKFDSLLLEQSKTNRIGKQFLNFQTTLITAKQKPIILGPTIDFHTAPTNEPPITIGTLTLDDFVEIGEITLVRKMVPSTIMGNKLSIEYEDGQGELPYILITADLYAKELYNGMLIYQIVYDGKTIAVHSDGTVCMNIKYHRKDFSVFFYCLLPSSRFWP